MMKTHVSPHRKSKIENRKSAIRNPHFPRAFTLVEVLLAIGLCALLMVGIYGALELYRQLTTVGRTDVERAQIARAVLRTIEIDVRSIVYRDPALEASAAQAADEAAVGTVSYADETSDDESIAGEIDAASSFAGQSVGVIGDATSLVLHISRPSRTLDYGLLLSDGTAPARTSDLQSVSYFIADADAGGLQAAVGNLAAGGTTQASRERSVQGLARLEGDRLAMDLADTTGDIDSLAAGAKILAPEIGTLFFRYYDGLQWLDTWDSQIMGRLPQAIEVTLGFIDESQNEQTPFIDNLSTTPAGDEWRLVIPLPLSSPNTEELGL